MVLDRINRIYKIMNIDELCYRIIGAAMTIAACGCWSPFVVGAPLMEPDETIYGVHIQPLVGFSKHQVVGVNVAARMEPNISGDRLPNASEVTGLAIGVVSHEVWGDIFGAQIGGIEASASGNVRGVQFCGWGNHVSTLHGVQVSLIGNSVNENEIDRYISPKHSPTNTSRCVQVGLINICGDHWFPLINFNYRNSSYDKDKGLKFCPW